MYKISHNIIVGIDEAGRGPLAGPVAVGAVVVPENIKHRVFNVFGELKIARGKVRDSKQLSEKRREEIFKKIKEQAKTKKLKYTVRFGSVKMIDEEGINRAICLAMTWALRSLKINPSKTRVLLDGSLHAPKEFKNQKTIIKGDEKETIIALASICAKVLRDQKMRQLAKKYPKYGFETHKGYGTKAHYRAIKKYGLSHFHRKNFCKKVS